jgi:hypothetical protein
MSTRTRVELLDDIDGTPAVESITFSLDGVVYEIDLNEANSAALRDDAFGRYIDAGRRVGGRLQSGTAKATKVTQLPDARPPITSRERKSIQKWAKSKGFAPPGDRGRIASRLVQAWNDDGSPI